MRRITIRTVKQPNDTRGIGCRGLAWLYVWRPALDVTPNVQDIASADPNTSEATIDQGQFVLSKNFRRNNGLGAMLDLAAQMG